MQLMDTHGDNHSQSDSHLERELVDDLRHRLSRIEGHVRGVRKMLEEERDCDDILTQVAGVKAALQQATIKLLEGHLETCVREAIGGNGGNEAASRFKTSLSRVLK